MKENRSIYSDTFTYLDLVELVNIEWLYFGSKNFHWHKYKSGF